VRSGKESTGRDVVEWAKEAVLRGAGEILLTSFDRDGTRSGYDTALLKAVADAVNVPVIASGGASTAHHMVDAFKVNPSPRLLCWLMGVLTLPLTSTGGRGCSARGIDLPQWRDHSGQDQATAGCRGRQRPQAGERGP
jgi:hypothetical protein